jgi:hypothetical protein
MSDFVRPHCIQPLGFEACGKTPGASDLRARHARDGQR